MLVKTWNLIGLAEVHLSQRDLIQLRLICLPFQLTLLLLSSTRLDDSEQIDYSADLLIDGCPTADTDLSEVSVTTTWQVMMNESAGTHTASFS